MRKMIFGLIIITGALASARDICIRGFIHQRSHIYGAEVHTASRIAIDINNAVLYYTTVRENMMNAVRYYKLPEFEGGILFEIKNPVQITVDRFTGKIFLVASNDSTGQLNLYTYKDNNITKLADNIGSEDSYLYQLYANKNNVYWIGDDNLMHRYSNGRIGKHNIKILAYLEDGEASYYIKQKDERNVYKVKNGQKEQLRYISNDLLANLKMDANGVILAGSILTDKLYTLSEDEGRLVAVSDAFPESTTYLHFDHANDIIGAEGDETFVKYTRTLKKCTV